MSSLPWSTDRITLLSNLWRSGQSAAQIAKALGGVSRNAVIGKIHRLGLAKRDAPAPPGTRAPRARRARAKAAARPAPPSPPRSPPPAAPVARARARPAALADAVATVFDTAHLTARTCRWPIGDPALAGFGYCGRPAPLKTPYCAEHHAVGHVRVVQARRGSLGRGPVCGRVGGSRPILRGEGPPLAPATSPPSGPLHKGRCAQSPCGPVRSVGAGRSMSRTARPSHRAGMHARDPPAPSPSDRSPWPLRSPGPEPRRSQDPSA